MTICDSCGWIEPDSGDGRCAECVAGIRSRPEAQGRRTEARKRQQHPYKVNPFDNPGELGFLKDCRQHYGPEPGPCSKCEYMRSQMEFRGTHLQYGGDSWGEFFRKDGYPVEAIKP